MSTEAERCTCGKTACESELCDCDAIPCPVNHRAEAAEAEISAEVVDDMVARYAAHKIATVNTGTSLRASLTSSCSCGWVSGVTSDDLRPQWDAIDKHLISDVLPAWQSGVCWCGRAILLSPLGAWFHAERSLGHTATPVAQATTEEKTDEA